MKTVVVTGTLAYDYIFDFNNYFSNYILPEKIHQINISLLTDHYKKSFGGTAGNQGFYLSKLNHPTLILGVGGNDFSEYKKFLFRNKITSDFIKIYNQTHTAAGFAITDKRDNQIWMYSQGVMRFTKNLSLTPFQKNSKNIIVLITPNELKAKEKFIDECIKYRMEFVFDMGFNIPLASKELLLKGIKFAKIIFGNDYEIGLIEKRTGASFASSLKQNQILITTFADKGSEVLTNGKKYKIGICKVKTIDPTGAGDAYRAGFIYGYLNNFPVKTCGWMGAVTASFAVEVKGTMNLKFNKKEFEKRLSKVQNLKFK